MQHPLSGLFESLSQNFHDSSPAVIQCHVVSSSSPSIMMGLRRGLSARNNRMFSSGEEFLPYPRFPKATSLKIEEVDDDDNEHDNGNHEDQQDREDEDELPQQKSRSHRPSLRYKGKEPEALTLKKKPLLPIKLELKKEQVQEAPLAPPAKQINKDLPHEIWGEIQDKLYELPISEVYQIFLQVFAKIPPSSSK